MCNSFFSEVIKNYTRIFSVGTGTDLLLPLQFATWLGMHSEPAGGSGSFEWVSGRCLKGLCGLGGALGACVWTAWNCVQVSGDFSSHRGLCIRLL